MTEGFRIRRLGVADAAAFRAIRLEALAAQPEAFGSSVEEEAAQPEEVFTGRLAEGAVFGGWLEGRPELAGVMALAVPDKAKSRHKGLLWGVYLCPVARGTGLAPAMLRHLLDHARGVVEEVRLSVTRGNGPARSLYLRAGFTDWALEPRALKIGDTYHDEHLMVLRF
jgi:GNAT superfamily N-acetyltransferase